MKTRERIYLALIEDNPWQPRQEIDPDALQRLADSIKSVGLLQAPLARALEGGRIQLAFGHRRVAAYRLLHQTGQIEPYIEMDVDDELTDEEMAVMALSENVARRQLTQIEVVRAHRRAIDETGLTIQGLADKLGVSRSALSNNLRVLELPDVVLQHVESGALRVSVAREFLVLQNATHAHVDDMREVVKAIADSYRVKYHGDLPNWSRKNVRKEISERVANNEQDFRPLGPRTHTGHYSAGSAREATFDVEAFSFEFPDTLHTIPAGDASRVWTCEVKEWRRRQTQATREANKAAEVSGTNPKSGSSSAPSREKQFEQLLAKDPVFKKIVAARVKKGPKRPMNDEERQALGTRAELRDVDYDTKFWKILEVSRSSQDPYTWDKGQGGTVPHWFPDLDECRGCIIGASYAKSRSSYMLEKPALVCFNKEHYEEKRKAGEAAYREQIEQWRREVDRMHDDAALRFIRELDTLPDGSCFALAAALLAAQPQIQLEHPAGEPHKKWSYETASVATLRRMLGGTTPNFERYGRQGFGAFAPDPDLGAIGEDYIRQLVAALLVHHLHQGGRLETVSQETVAAPGDDVDPMAVRRLLTGETATAEVR